MKQEFMENMLKAKKYEAQAFASLLPDSLKPHIKAIQRELAEMLLDCVSGKGKQEEESTEVPAQKKVQKVKID